MLIIIQPPNTVGACRLKLVGSLDLPYKEQVLLENLVDGGLHVFGCVDPKLIKTEEEDHEAQLMTSAIVKPFIVAEALYPVRL